MVEDGVEPRTQAILGDVMRVLDKKRTNRRAMVKITTATLSEEGLSVSEGLLAINDEPYGSEQFDILICHI
jgi:hypothetical protein